MKNIIYHFRSIIASLLIALVGGLSWTVSAAESAETNRQTTVVETQKAAVNPGETQAWNGPDALFPRFDIPAIPLPEMEDFFNDRFQYQVDVLVPNSVRLLRDTSNGNRITMHLRNVNAQQVFNAMNLLFDAEKIPAHWDLVMNGSRPTVVLQVRQDLANRESHKVETDQNRKTAQQPMVRQIFYVGDLVTQSDLPGMTIEEIARSIARTYELGNFESPLGSNAIQCHREAEILVVMGTPEEILFVQEAIKALREKARHDRQVPTVLDATSKPVENGTKSQ